MRKKHEGPLPAGGMGPSRGEVRVAFGGVVQLTPQRRCLGLGRATG